MKNKSFNFLKKPKIFLFSGLFLSCILASCGGGNSQNKVVPVSPITPPVTVVKDVRPGTWVILGSSTASGTGATPGNSWADLLRENLSESGSSITNLAKGGTVSYVGLPSGTIPPANRPAPDPARNITQALSLKPVAIIISYPTNDVATGLKPEEAVNNINFIRTTAMNAGLAVLVTSTQPRNLSKEQLGYLVEIDKQLSATIGACFVSVREALSGPDGKLLPEFNSGDGIHPNDAGHRIIFAKILSTIKSGTCLHLTS
jgi:acyl-CoA thioesterase I